MRLIAWYSQTSVTIYSDTFRRVHASTGCYAFPLVDFEDNIQHDLGEGRQRSVRCFC